jgi:TonB family protein
MPLPKPEYPIEARRNWQAGTAVVDLAVNEQGEISRARLAKSSGSAELDRAAVEGTRSWKLAPGTVMGKPTCMWGRFGISFSLNDFNEKDLETVDVGPNARAVAQLFLASSFVGQPNDASRRPALRSAVLAEVRNAMAGRPEWQQAEDEMAALLARDFTDSQLQELASFLVKPAGAKLIDEIHLHTLPIRSNNRRLGQLLRCMDATLQEAMVGKAPPRLVEGDLMLPADAESIHAFVDAAMPYCQCAIRAAGLRSDQGGGASSRPGSCGKPPAYK